MMTSWMLWIPVLGMMTGFRTMTPIAVVCWFAYLGHLPVDGTWAFWSAKLVAALLFTVLAIAEYVGDKLPQTPNRTAPGPLVARLAFGWLVGAVVATGLQIPAMAGWLLGTLGALAGAYAGYYARKHVVKWTQRPDWNIAVIEDVLTVLISIMAMQAITDGVRSFV
jgi:uncharacterized membrane protein